MTLVFNEDNLIHWYIYTHWELNGTYKKQNHWSVKQKNHLNNYFPPLCSSFLLIDLYFIFGLSHIIKRNLFTQYCDGRLPRLQPGRHNHPRERGGGLPHSGNLPAPLQKTCDRGWSWCGHGPCPAGGHSPIGPHHQGGRVRRRGHALREARRLQEGVWYLHLPSGRTDGHLPTAPRLTRPHGETRIQRKPWNPWPSRPTRAPWRARKARPTRSPRSRARWLQLIFVHSQNRLLRRPPKATRRQWGPEVWRCGDQHRELLRAEHRQVHLPSPGHLLLQLPRPEKRRRRHKHVGRPAEEWSGEYITLNVSWKHAKNKTNKQRK